jgi:neuronal calcium sensor 1
MDQNKDGTITFKEFLIFQSITAPTTTPLNPDELIDSIYLFFIIVAFDMYDEDNDGYVTAEEMKESLTNMFKARNLDVSSKEVTNTINQRIENLLVLADENGDGKLTREEIQKACKKDPSLLVMF